MRPSTVPAAMPTVLGWPTGPAFLVTTAALFRNRDRGHKVSARDVGALATDGFHGLPEQATGCTWCHWWHSRWCGHGCRPPRSGVF
jgi:hypothetical protein